MNAAPDTLAFRVRPMTYADIEAVMEIEARAYPFPWSDAIFRDCMRVGYACHVLEGPVWLEGYGVLSVGAGESHLLNLCVRPESEGRGLARQLLSYLLEEARRRGAGTTFLEVRPSNPRAVRLYQGMDFCEVGVRRGYYPDAKGREDALVMARSL